VKNSLRNAVKTNVPISANLKASERLNGITSFNAENRLFKDAGKAKMKTLFLHFGRMPLKRGYFLKTQFEIRSGYTSTKIQYLINEDIANNLIDFAR